MTFYPCLRQTLIYVVQSLCISKLAHLAMVLPDLEENKLKELENLYIDFVWGSGRRKVAYNDAKHEEIEGDEYVLY